MCVIQRIFYVIKLTNFHTCNIKLNKKNLGQLIKESTSKYRIIKVHTNDKMKMKQVDIVVSPPAFVWDPNLTHVGP